MARVEGPYVLPYGQAFARPADSTFRDIPAFGFGIRLGVFTQVRWGLSGFTRTAFLLVSRSLRFAEVRVAWYQNWYQRSAFRGERDCCDPAGLHLRRFW